MKEDATVTKEEEVLKSKQRTRDSVRSKLFNKCGNLNVCAEAVWQRRAAGKATVRSPGVLVDVVEDAYFRSQPAQAALLHDRVQLWNCFGRPLTNCWLSNGYEGRNEERFGVMTVANLEGVKAQILCDQLPSLVEAVFELTPSEKQLDAWQRLRDLEIQVKTKPFDVLVDQGQFVYVWFNGYPKLRDVLVEATISDGGTKRMTERKALSSWELKEQAVLVFSQKKGDLWKPQKIQIRITDKPHEVSVSLEVIP